MHFKELLNIEAQVRWVNKYSPKEIKALFRTHPEDFTPEIEACFFDLKDSGKTIRLVLLEEVEDGPEPVSEELLPPTEEKHERDPIAIKRQRLALNIESYALQFNKTIDEIKQEIYDRYKITSRKELTIEQLNQEIRRYRPFTDQELQMWQ